MKHGSINPYLLLGSIAHICTHQHQSDVQFTKFNGDYGNWRTCAIMLHHFTVHHYTYMSSKCVLQIKLPLLYSHVNIGQRLHQVASCLHFGTHVQLYVPHRAQTRCTLHYECLCMHMQHGLSYILWCTSNRLCKACRMRKDLSSSLSCKLQRMKSQIRLNCSRQKCRRGCQSEMIWPA